MIGRKEFALCPKWEKCSAPICPLDTDWKKRMMLAEDRVCFLMNEAVKSGAEDRFKLSAYSELYATIHEAMHNIIASNVIIKNRLNKASNKQSRMEFVNRQEVGKGGD